MKVVVVAAGDLAPGDVAGLDDADVVIAADGGGESVVRVGRRPDRLVGDLDSVDPETVARLEAAGTTVERHPADKEASDTELALRAALDAGATSVVLLGATGGERLDHELANLLLLVDPSFAGLPVTAVHGDTTMRAVRAGERLALAGRIGDLVTLLPIGGEAVGVTTTGLRWTLRDAVLRLGGSRGLSNQVVAPPAAVAVDRGALLVVEISTGGTDAP